MYVKKSCEVLYGPHKHAIFSELPRFARERAQPPLPHIGRAFAATITAVALILASALGLTAPLQKSRRRPCAGIYTIRAGIYTIHAGIYDA